MTESRILLLTLVLMVVAAVIIFRDWRQVVRGALGMNEQEYRIRKSAWARRSTYALLVALGLVWTTIALSAPAEPRVVWLLIGIYVVVVIPACIASTKVAQGIVFLSTDRAREQRADDQ